MCNILLCLDDLTDSLAKKTKESFLFPYFKKGVFKIFNGSFPLKI